MSFIVKGVDLPKKAGELLAVNICDGFISVYTVTPKDTVIEHKAEAVQIPKGHGDIKDINALELEKEVELADDWKTAHEIANCVKYAPTILEAEEE